MGPTKQFRLFDSRARGRLQVVVPGCCGAIMLTASFSPWLVDPLGTASSAWLLPVDIGWQLRLSVFSYGLLCLGGALYAFLVAWANWRPFRGGACFVQKQAVAGILCIVPFALFVLQYLCIDVRGVSDLAQHTVQALLIQQHFGYNLPRERIPMDPFSVDVSTISGRLLLLVNQMSVGVIMPWISAGLLWGSNRSARFASGEGRMKKRWRLRGVLGVCVLLFVLGRGPAAVVCEYEAKVCLADGNYTLALNWLHSALTLNPALNQTAFYHIQQGQASYFLQRSDASDDSRAYLAWVYRKQGDDIDAYQQDLAIWQRQRTMPWVLDELRVTLERLTEFVKAPNGSIVRRSAYDHTTLIWLQLLTEENPATAYGHYMSGRVLYDLRSYSLCIAQMEITLRLTSNADIRSSAYTYIALSAIGQGQYSEARDLLFMAIALDPDYRNNTAREELSGLH